MRNDRRIGFLIVFAQKFQRPIREDHAEPEGGVGRILLNNSDVDIQVGGA